MKYLSLIKNAFLLFLATPSIVKAVYKFYWPEKIPELPFPPNDPRRDIKYLELYKRNGRYLLKMQEYEPYQFTSWDVAAGSYEAVMNVRKMYPELKLLDLTHKKLPLLGS